MSSSLVRPRNLPRTKARHRAASLDAMSTRTLATIAGFMAVGLQVGARVVIMMAAQPTLRLAALFAGFVSIAILISAVRMIAVSKGRHPGWSFLGLFSIVGLLIVLCFKDSRRLGKASK